jgi:hypothetical protein
MFICIRDFTLNIFRLEKNKKQKRNKNIFGRGPEKESDDDGVIYSKGEVGKIKLPFTSVTIQDFCVVSFDLHSQMICDVTPKIYTLSPKNHFDRKELFG